MTVSEHKDTLVKYLLSCVERRDWHGVSDAANDLRVLEIRLEQEVAKKLEYSLGKTAKAIPDSSSSIMGEKTFHKVHDNFS